MKRSEMVEIISTYFWDCYDMDNELAAFDSGELLGLIEKAGMLPPIIKEKSFKMQDDGQMSYAVHEWESENES